ncbi:MAG: hypothetical protein ABIE94_06990 [archaeon]
MGSFIELNDTLQITTEQGFPPELVLEKHLKKPFTPEDFKGRVFKFQGKEGQRIFQMPPSRCFLAHNIKGKWLYWGEVEMLSQTIDSRTKTTSGEYRITKIYDSDYQKKKTLNETPEGKCYF